MIYRCNSKKWLGIVVTLAILVTVFLLNTQVANAELSIVSANDPESARQRLEENVGQLVQAMAVLGNPISDKDRMRLEAIRQLPDDEAVGRIQQVLDVYTLVTVHIDDEAWFKIVPASSDPNTRRLVQKHWKSFLIKVNNEGRVTSPLEVRSPQAVLPLNSIESNYFSPTYDGEVQHDWSQWFLVRFFKEKPMPTNLSGKEVEYFILQMCSLDSGIRAGELVFYLGGGQVSQGHFADVNLIFFIDRDRDD